MVETFEMYEAHSNRYLEIKLEFAIARVSVVPY